MKRKIASALLAAVAVVLFAAPGMAAARSADLPVSPSAPAPTDAPTAQPYDANFPPPAGGPHLDSDDSTRAGQLEQRYGKDRDISTPPLVVTPKSDGAITTKAINIDKYLPSSMVRPKDLPKAKVLKLQMSKSSVVSDLSPASFASPAQDFMRFAYGAIGVLVIVLLTLAVRLTAGKDRLDK